MPAEGRAPRSGPGEAAAAAAAEGPRPAAPSGGPLELAAARRRLLEAEARRRLVWELESRVRALHAVLVEAEGRVARRAESLGRLGGGVAQAELSLAAHGQRLKRSLRRWRKARGPALLAAALGRPWAACRGAPRAPQPEGRTRPPP